jgi:hypothetical protein
MIVPGSFNLMNTIEELLERKSSSSSLESQEYGRRDPSLRLRGTLYPQTLALTSQQAAVVCLYYAVQLSCLLIRTFVCKNVIWAQCISSIKVLVSASHHALIIGLCILLCVYQLNIGITSVRNKLILMLFFLIPFYLQAVQIL